MHFWSGSTVLPEEITDIPAYNRENGMMWAIYTACMFLTGVVSLFQIIAGVVLLITISIPGIIVLILVYNRIYNKYKSAVEVSKLRPTNEKTPKAVLIAILGFVGVIFILIGVMLYYGSQEPVIHITDNSIQIEAMYGIKVNIAEIKSITLMEKSMRDIGVGTRTNGYGGLGETLKGNFESDSLGKYLLFVRESSSPTIKIERTDKKDIYISFQNSETTKNLYKELNELPLK
jgi:hypothetical protein